jgi:hypothetical protein
VGSRWRGLLAPINKPTGDGRRIAPGGFTNRPLPLPLKWQRADSNGHDESVTVGVIDVLNIDEEAGEVWGEVELFDDVNPATTPQLAEDAATARTLMEKGVVGPSVDPGSAQATAVMTGMDRAPTMAEIQRFCDQNDGNMPPTEMLFTSYEIAGATLVPIPAFSEARPLELMEPGAGLTASRVRTGGWDSLPIASQGRAWDADAARARLAADCGLDGDSPDWDCYASGFLYEYTDRDPQTRGAYSFPVVDIVDGQRQLIPAAVYAAANILSGGRGGTDIPAEKQKTMRGVVAGLYKRLAKEFDDDSIRAPWAGKMSAILAAASLPPLDGSLFLDPQLDQITPLTREPLGNGWTRVFGHIATHDVCLVGQPGVCTTAPFSDQDYQTFHRYHKTAGGIELPLAVGRLTAAHGQLSATCRCCPGNDDHACNNIGFGAAVAHHDRMRVLAYGRAGEDEKNNAIWFAGVEAPEADERDIKLLNRRKVSGDWREIAGNMELTEILVLSRRDPGFPLPRVSMENGRQRSLTAASPIGAIIEREDGEVTAVDTQQLGEALGHALAGVLDEFGFNPNQKRGPDGKFIKMGGKGSAGGGPGLPGRKPGPNRKSEGGGSGAGGRDSGAGGGDDAAAKAIADTKAADLPFQQRIIADNMARRLQAAIDSGDDDSVGEQTAALNQLLAQHTPEANRQRAADAAEINARADEITRRGASDRGRPDPVMARKRGAFNDDILLEARAVQEENEDDPDNELEDQIELVQRLMREQGTKSSPEIDNAVEHLRGMLLVSYLDSEDLPEFDPDDFPGITAAAQAHTGAMVALRMSEADAARLAVTDGEPLDQLHLTLAYLGDADQIPPEVREKIAAKMHKVAGSYKEPLAGDGFAIDVFNPGTVNDRDTAIVMGVGGQPMADVHTAVMAGLGKIDGLSMPEQHTPHIPHVTLQYTNDLDRVKALADRVGPVTFDRLRLAFGGEITDIPIGAVVDSDGDEDDSDEDDQQDAAFASDIEDGKMCAKMGCGKSSTECASCSDCTPAVLGTRAQAAALALRATLASTQLGCCKTPAR